MLFIHNTISLCNHCYKHIPAIVYEDDDSIKMAKKCSTHGVLHSTVEVDPEFYYELQHHIDIETFNQVLFEITDRCQLNCPHCYHLPDNKIVDKDLALIIEQVKKFPQDSMPMFAGAEPTLRKDFVEMCAAVKELNFKEFTLLSNGIKFADKAFTKNCFEAGLSQLCLGLNHYSYQGSKIHNKQLKALDNLLDIGYTLGYVGYTIESIDDIPDILEEIQLIDNKKIEHYRIRCGSFIGRSLDKERSYLSNLVKKVKSILGNEVQYGYYDDNPYHVTLKWGDRVLRLIQWPDVTNIDLEELATGPWCNFYEGPITNFVHQVITRDAFINMKLPKLDIVPTKYQYRSMNIKFPHWKDDWTAPVPFKKFDWDL